MSMFSSTRCLILALALPALVACGDTTEAPAPEAAPEAPAEPTPEATPEATPESSGHSLTLDTATSTVGWTSIKNGDAPVKGTFTKVSGGLSLTAADLGATTGELTFDLSGVDSGLELRDQRISETFFGVTAETAAGAVVKLTKLSPETATLEPGGSTPASADLSVGIGGGSASAQAQVTVTRTDENTWTVVSTDDVKLSVKALGLAAPLQALLTLCGHASVDDSVAISLNLTFKAAE